MERSLPLEERSLNQIYFDGQESVTYKIPVYQRNYAWGEDEITALVKDVHDSFRRNSDSPYYIGTLVTYKRGDNEYEVIDGQQRLTTVYLILKALGKAVNEKKLEYSARPFSTVTLKNLGRNDADMDSSLCEGYGFSKKALGNIVEEAESQKFTEYFLHKVRVIHYKVPEDVDLNHYFEVMNSRGEQLEKPEILKAKLIEYLDKEDNPSRKADVSTFSRVWEACSEMNVYIQQLLEDDKSGAIFGKDGGRLCVDSFSELLPQDEDETGKTQKEAGPKDKISLRGLMENLSTQADYSEKNKNDNFLPIIDFPNLLLIVLKIMQKDKTGFDPGKFSLDDKELLQEFSKTAAAETANDEFARQYLYNLLKARHFLDNYVVHHSLIEREKAGDNPWKLQRFHYEGTKSYPKNLADGKVQEELTHILSMFEVTFTAKQRKNYLFYVLAYLFEHSEASAEDYLHFLRKLADKYFFDIYLNPECLNNRNLPVPNAFDKVVLSGGKLNLDLDETDYTGRFDRIYKSGSPEISLFVFNYTDYRIWKEYADRLRGQRSKKDSPERIKFFEVMGCSDFSLDPFDDFYFSRTRKSLEHYYPQANAGEGKPLSDAEVNCFGNFAMIGSGVNSSGSNHSPLTKFIKYTDVKADPVSVASLKFRIMMQCCKDNEIKMYNKELPDRSDGQEWNAEDIRKHQQKMLDIILHPSR